MISQFPNENRFLLFLCRRRCSCGRMAASRRQSPEGCRTPGLGLKIPKEVCESHYIDKKYPYTGNVSIRGGGLTGTIIKMKNTVVIRRD